MVIYLYVYSLAYGVFIVKVIVWDYVDNSRGALRGVVVYGYLTYVRGVWCGDIGAMCGARGELVARWTGVHLMIMLSDDII